ncbi:RICIN domain-containing protein [Streptomyces longispororuber]|uniref:RICIN domain-containing protein n=1 Tax=Streptomyces longispororuber TaxID=68230 RepID=UPI0036FE63B4
MTALSEGIYLFKNEASGLYATVQPGAGEKQGAKVVLEELRGEGPARHGQLWHLRPHSARDGAWTIQNVLSTFRMDIMANRSRGGAAVQQCPAESRDDLLASQLWRPQETAGADEDTYAIVNVNSGKHLSVRGGRREVNAELEQAEPRTGVDRGTQVWRLERVPALGQTKGFDALTASVVSGTGGGVIGTVVSGLTGAAKGVLDAGGGVFETMAKVVTDPKAPYLRFDGFRGDEFIRFSQRHGIESGPKKITEQFTRPPRGFPEHYDDVMTARRGSGHTHAAILTDTIWEFSERSASTAPRRLDAILAPREKTHIDAATIGDAQGETVVLFLGDQVVRAPADDFSRGRDFPLQHTPEAFRSGLDTATSTAVDDEMHYFLVKGDEFVVVSEGRLIQDATKLADAYPFLNGVWM